MAQGNLSNVFIIKYNGKELRKKFADIYIYIYIRSDQSLSRV